MVRPSSSAILETLLTPGRRPTVVVGLFLQQAIAMFVLKSGAGFKIFSWIAILASDFLAQVSRALRLQLIILIPDMRWRNTIKCRHFLDGQSDSVRFKAFADVREATAIQDSFFQKFATSLKATSNLHQDQWTLAILSKSICMCSAFPHI